GDSKPAIALGPADTRAGRTHARPDCAETHRRHGRRRQGQGDPDDKSDWHCVAHEWPDGSPRQYGHEAPQFHAHGDDYARPELRSGIRWHYSMDDQSLHGFTRPTNIQ